MFGDHNPLKYFDFETEGAVTTWPAGADEFNRDYTMESLGDVPQVYCDGGWVTSNEGYQSGGGMFGIGGQEVEQEGNRMLFFGEEPEHLDRENMIFTGPDLYNSDLAELSGQEIDRNGVEDDSVAAVRKQEDGYMLEAAEDPEDMRDCIAFGYAEAFDDGFPVITVENARDAYMALGYDEEFQDELDERHVEIRERVREAESEVREEYIDDDNWSKPGHRDEIDERKRYGLHQAIAEAYVEAEGEHHDQWNPDRELNYFHPEDLEEFTTRDDRVSELAENLLELQESREEVREETREKSRNELLPEFLEENWYRNVVKPSAEMRDAAREAGEEFLGVHDVHDVFHADMQGAKFENPRLSDSEKLSALVNAAEREFNQVKVYGVPWDSEVDGKEQTMEMRDDLQDFLPTYEDLIPEEDLPAIRSSEIFNGTPFRPVMALSDEPVEVNDEDLVDLTQMLEE
ncbi:MAG: hypothetical protein ABEK10_02495 [Candidatus Nanosalina sp.]